MDEGYKISFGFWHVAKAQGDNQGRRRCLVGISSGSKLDRDDERMTDKCVKGMMEQANSGEILLYPDVHGIRATEDIGRLTLHKILDDGDWWTEYDLHSPDQVGAQKAEKIDTVWAQMNGLPPYARPLQRGFSIEARIPKNGILDGQIDQFGRIRKRVIDEVQLDGVLLVPRQAYKPGGALAVCKSLDELNPFQREHLRKGIASRLSERISQDEARDSFFHQKWALNDVFEDEIDKIMRRDMPDKREQLSILFDEYKGLLISLILQSSDAFSKIEDMPSEAIESKEAAAKVELFKSLEAQVSAALKIINKRV